jgi:hypothetical protein
MIPHTRLLPLLIAISALTVSAQQSGVVGDSSKKVYWSAHCGESRIVPLKDTVTFASVDAAEKAGFRSASSCSQGSVPIGPIKLQPDTTTVGELAKESASFKIIGTDIAKYRRTTARIIGNFGVSQAYAKPYQRRQSSYYGFVMSDSRGGTGFFYILRGPRAEELQKAATDPVEKWMADCKVRIDGLEDGYVYGEILDCRIWNVDAL